MRNCFNLVILFMLFTRNCAVATSPSGQVDSTSHCAMHSILSIIWHASEYLIFEKIELSFSLYPVIYKSVAICRVDNFSVRRLLFLLLFVLLDVLSNLEKIAIFR